MNARTHAAASGGRPDVASPQEVAEVRTLLMWSRREMAAAFGVTEVTISRWESGARSMGPDNTRLLRKLLAEQGLRGGKTPPRPVLAVV